MQHPAVPELAHTHARPVHWLATATAVAGVVALSAVVQPDAATAAQPAGLRPGGTSAAPAAAPPATDGVDFPLDCGPVDLVIARRATGDLDGDGRPETVAVVHCDAGMSTPPDAVYVLTRDADTAQPRVVATLVDARERRKVTEIAVRGGAVRADLLGYSSPDVPTCCPDVTDTVKWRWTNGAFARSTPSGARSV